jgi:thiamine biosynthesis protein ThiI
VPCIVVRYHEIALKGGNRQRFVACLVRNLRESTAGLGVRGARSLPGRIVLRLADGADVEAICARVAETFGVANLSPGVETALDLDAVREAAVAGAARARFRSFRVATRRANKQFPLTSPEVNALVGRAVQEATGAAVDLTAAELTITVEILPRGALVSTRKLAGPGGLPVSISGRVTCLLSGGIDSPVAAYRMMQRGCRVDFVHFHGTPYTDRRSLDKARELATHLARFQRRSDLWAVPFGEIQAQIVARVPRTHRVVLYRRMMLRIAAALAARAGGRALVTGESLGQVASQTLHNIARIDEVATMPIFRPLIGTDKLEITAEAQRLGTFEISIEPDADCCTLFTPKHPATRMSEEAARTVEATLDVPRLVAMGTSGATLASFAFPDSSRSSEKDNI